jgi:hypothetical protein
LFVPPEFFGPATTPARRARRETFMSLSADAPTLESLFRRIEPSARLVPIRALRRYIRLSRDTDSPHVRAVHDRSWWVARDQLFQLLLPIELNLSPNEPAAELLLLPAPADGVSNPTPREIWQTLFHAALDREIDRALADGGISPPAIRELRQQIGPAPWHAARAILIEENLIDESDDDLSVFREWSAFGFELAHFAPDQWEAYFPGLSMSGEPMRTAARLVDADRLLDATRPQSLDAIPPGEPPVGTPEVAAAPVRVTLTDAGRRQIEKWTAQGNDLGAAILLQQAADPTAVGPLDRLLGRLHRLLDLTPNASRQWQEVLTELLPRAARGEWPVEQRLLYELQRACLAVERQTYAANLVGWIVTLGRRPLKRALTKPRWPDATRRLRAAARYADRLSPEDPIRATVHHLLESAVHTAEGRARADLRPDVQAVLDEVGLVPRSVAEERSRDKLVAELLDAACARGFLRIGDLRDAIARNRVKLPDLAGPGELVRGDPLIRANRKLAVRLDGVYRKGEAYMRLLQRGCSVFFGTRPGRWLTRYVALPFGGAFILLEAFHHMVEAGEGLVNWLSGWDATVNAFAALAGGAGGSVAADPHRGEGGATWPVLLVLGVFLLLLIHWPAFRSRIARGIQLAFVKFPRAVRRSAIVQFLVQNALTRYVRRYLAMPVFIGALTALLTWLAGADATSVGLIGGGMAVLSGTLFRTPFGRFLEDRLNEEAERVWRLVSVNLILGALTLILQFFQAVFEAFDRAIYAVDEWLRFGEGESKITFAFKLLFGTVWSVFTYLFRFAWTLLVEPQINPIKHFPVVTVSHKLLLPLIPSLAKSFGTKQETMGTIVFGIPGIFGFLVWELKENWKLYRANASATIRPAVVGSHGERVRGLLRPGFHSGVVPKTFARLRKALRAGNEARALRHRHALAHVAEAVHRLAERDFVAYLAGSRRWAGLPLWAARPLLTPNRIRLPFHTGDATQPMIVSLEERGGWVIASVEEPGPLGTLTGDQQAAFADVLAGLYKLAGVHAVREQTARVLGPAAYQFDAVPEGLLIPLPDGREQLHDYDDGPDVHSPDRRLPSDTIVLSDRPLAWADWVERWEADAAGKSPTGLLLAGWSLLPPRPDRPPTKDDEPSDHHSERV